MTNPTPTTREREAARDIASHYPRNLYGRQYHDCIDRITAALARARREALTRAAEVARNERLNPTFEWREHNLACDVIAAAIEAMRDGAGL